MNIGDKIFIVTLLAIFLANFLRIGYLIDRDMETTFLTVVFLILEFLGINIIYLFINHYFYKTNLTDSVIFGSVIMLLMLLAALSEYYDIRKEKKSYQEIERKKW